LLPVAGLSCAHALLDQVDLDAPRLGLVAGPLRPFRLRELDLVLGDARGIQLVAELERARLRAVSSGTIC